MAKAPDKAGEPAAEAPANASNKKRGLIIIILGVVLLVASAGGGFLFWKNSHKAEGDEAKAEHAKNAKAEAPPVIVKLDQFTVKLQADENKPEQYIQTVIELEVIDSHTADKVKSLTAKIRSKVLLLLMGKTPSELSSPQGVEALTAEIRNHVNEIIDGAVRPPGTLKAGPDDSVQAVYLTQFIIQ